MARRTDSASGGGRPAAESAARGPAAAQWPRRRRACERRAGPGRVGAARQPPAQPPRSGAEGTSLALGASLAFRGAAPRLGAGEEIAVRGIAPERRLPGSASAARLVRCERALLGAAAVKAKRLAAKATDCSGCARE